MRHRFDDALVFADDLHQHRLAECRLGM